MSNRAHPMKSSGHFPGTKSPARLNARMSQSAYLCLVALKNISEERRSSAPRSLGRSTEVGGGGPRLPRLIQLDNRRRILLTASSSFRRRTGSDEYWLLDVVTRPPFPIEVLSFRVPRSGSKPRHMILYCRRSSSVKDERFAFQCSSCGVSPDSGRNLIHGSKSSVFRSSGISSSSSGDHEA